MAKKSSKGGGKPIPKVEVNLVISPPEIENLLATLQERFEQNMDRHEGLEWNKIAAKLEGNPEKLTSLNAMEATGGEPDVVGYDAESSEYIFMDCSAESPQRRSICYDEAALAERHKKGVFPGGSAVGLAARMGIELLNEEQYRQLQTLGEFDTKTSSWLQTPTNIRKLGGAIFADRRFGHVFVYHNGAPSFYGGRGFRGLLRV
ncbi:DUF4256 domain-containing protein [Candidatus Leptofilum sp.]|uniref:DUF4256 domain-containing protein n=1 Tax=Candidatus Leptofilum sp. TaxID=3241576 RepID=UPI003B5BDD71